MSKQNFKDIPLDTREATTFEGRHFLIKLLENIIGGGVDLGWI